MKKILAMVLCIAMVLSVMTFTVSAETTNVAEVNGVGYATIQEAINAAGVGDTVIIAAGEYSRFDISNKEITIQGTVDVNGELLTTIVGGDPAITAHGFNGTIKNLNIANAWKVMYAEPAGNITIDNVYVTGATYGFHFVAYSPDLTWTLQNCYEDISWANSFGTYNNGSANIIAKNNKFESTAPYYPNLGALPINVAANGLGLTVEDNIFGESTRIYVDNSITDTSVINIGANYYADGVENALADDPDNITFEIKSYYADVNENNEPTGLVDATKTYVASVENEAGNVSYYEKLEDAFKAVNSASVIEILSDVTIDYKWDCRNTGAKFTVPVIINGNGHTLKFTNEINDGFNYLAAIRAEADLAVNDFTIDMSEAISVFQNKFSAISTKGGDLTIDGCTFIGSTVYTNDRAIIFGEGGSAADEAEIVVNDSQFIDWGYGVVDNMNRVDVAKSVEISNSDFDASRIHISAANEIVLTDNVVEDAYVNITSYSDTNELVFTATGNTLETNSEAGENFVNAKVYNGQNDFAFPVASVINVVLKSTGDANVYDIVLESADKYEIYEFVSAELTFANASKTVGNNNSTLQYTISGIKDATSAQRAADYDKDDQFIFSILEDGERLSGKSITIGQVTFEGQGTVNFKVAGGKVATTRQDTNLGKYYTTEVGDETLKIDLAKIEDGAINEVKRNVAVNIAFNHNIVADYWNNNMITVTIKDGFGNVDTKDVAISNNAGICTFSDVKLGRLTVTVEGKGFRKYVYETTLEDGNGEFVLNFWNDVKRVSAEVIETGKFTMFHNFLVGDIVMDYIVDEYDLAAVTSYYGTYDINKADASKYIKYDLNRDGSIDIIDVQYVLHTLNN